MSRRVRAHVKLTSPGSGARLRASQATYSARVPSRCQSVRPSTLLSHGVPSRAIAEGGDHSGQLVLQGSTVFGHGRARSVQVEGHSVSVGTYPYV